MDTQGEPQLERLLAQADWIRELARGLVGDPAAADDLVQDTLVAALERPPGPGPLRPWLAGVARNLARLGRRGEGRRARRERESARPEGLPSTAALIEEVETQRRLARAVLELDEPYRTTLLLRYWQRLSGAEIARRQELPGGTVRSRLKRGLDELRRRLDVESGGDRTAWTLALAPLARALPPEAPKGVLPKVTEVVLMKTGKNAALGAAAVLCLAVGLGMWRGLAALETEGGEEPAIVAAAPGGVVPPSERVPAAAAADPLPAEPAAPEPRAEPVAQAPAPAAAVTTSIAVTPERDASTLLRYDPAAGLVLKKRFENTMRAREVEFRGRLDELHDFRQDVEQMTSVQVLVVTDRFVSSFGGRPTDVHRLFERGDYTLSTTLSSPDPSSGLSSEAGRARSRVAGANVLFRGTPRSGYEAELALGFSEHVLERADPGYRSDVLGALAFDLDLTALLPEDHDAAPGERWTVKDREKLVSLLLPGGDLTLRGEEVMDCPLAMLLPLPGTASVAAFAGDVRGTARCHYLEVDRGGERPLGIVEVELELRSSDDVARRLRKEKGGELAACLELWKRYHVDWEYEGRGRLRWDLEGRHPLSLRIEGEFQAKLDSTMVVPDQSGGRRNAKVRMELGGELVLGAAFQRER